MQPAKKIYESLLGDGVNATALVHVQVRHAFLVDIMVNLPDTIDVAMSENFLEQICCLCSQAIPVI